MKRLIVGAGVLIVAGAFAVGLLVDDPPQETSAVESPTPSPERHGVSRADDGVVLYSHPPLMPPSEPPPLSVEVAGPPPDPDFDPKRPPRATLSSASGDVGSLRGDSCWSILEGRDDVVCVQPSETLPVPDMHILADFGETLTLSFEHPEAPKSVDHEWWRKASMSADEGPPSREGAWILHVSSRWERSGMGAVSDVFRVDVRPR